ncbi:MAG: DJ-1/PfpI family protein [Patescibacteria group bacterium]
MTNVLLIVAQEGFQTKEYHDPKRVLEAAGHTVVTASAEKGVAISNIGEKVSIDVALRDVKVVDYDAVFVIGGPGALRFLDNDETARIMKEAKAREKMPYGAICVSPRILSKAGVLQGKKATGWDSDEKLAGIFDDGGAIYERAPVVIDGRIVTADGPASAEAFGHAIVNILKN